MSNTKQLAKILASIITILTIVWCIWYASRNDWGSFFAADQSRPVSTRELTMFADNWTPTIELGVGTNKKINWAAVGENVPFIVQINGGPTVGGYEYFRPARVDEDKPIWGPGNTNKFVAPYFKGQIINVRFKLASKGLTQAQMAVTIQPDK